MTSPPYIRAYVNVKFEDKMAFCRAKKGDSFLIKIPRRAVSHLPPTPLPSPQKGNDFIFQDEEINVGISLKAHGYSHLLHKNICKLSQIRKKYMPKNEMFPMQKK